MLSYGAVAYNIRQQNEAIDDDASDRFEKLWIARLEIFQRCAPEGRFELVQWLRALGKIVTAFGDVAEEEKADVAELRRLCRVAMLAVRSGAPDVARHICFAAAEATRLAPRFNCAHKIADRLIESLKPQAACTIEAFTPKQLATRWTCSDSRVRDLISSRELTAFRIGRLWRVSAEVVREFERKHVPAPEAPKQFDKALRDASRLAGLICRVGRRR